MNRSHMLIAGIVFVTVLGIGVMWKQSWGPDARARRVAEVMSGKTHPARGGADEVFDLFFKGTAGDGPVSQAQWATLELGALAKSHPGSLARAAIGTTPDVRFAFLDVIQSSDAYADLPVEMRLEHTAVHVVRTLDRGGSITILPAQEAALKADRVESLRVLHNALVAGHCGALVGYDVLGERPAPQAFVQAAEALARSAAQPLYSDMSEDEIARCRDLIAKRAAPTTDGGLQVIQPGRGTP